MANSTSISEEGPIIPTPMDLSQYHSDGQGTRPSGDMTRHSKRAPDHICLTHLTEVYNHYISPEDDGPITFTALPRGYTMYYCYLLINGVRQSEGFGYCFVFGHPNGHFEDWEEFAVHVDSIIKERLGACGCLLCAKSEPPDVSLSSEVGVKVEKRMI